MPTVQLKRIRRFEGKVVSAKTPKTIVVEVVQTTKHKKYLKIFLQHRRYHVHDPRQMFHEGNTVTFVACRPISRTKRWLVVYPKPESVAPTLL